MAFVFERFLVPEYANFGDSLIPQQLKDAVVVFANMVISTPDFFDENGKIMINDYQLDGQKVLLAMDYMFTNENILKQLTANQLSFGITEDNLIKAQKLAMDFVVPQTNDFSALFSNMMNSVFAVKLSDALSNAEIKKAYNSNTTTKMVASWGTKVIDAVLGISTKQSDAWDVLIQAGMQAAGVDDNVAKAIEPQRPKIMSVFALFAMKWIVYNYGLVSQSVEAEVVRQKNLGRVDLRGGLGSGESSAITFDASSFVKLGFGLGLLAGTYYLLKKQ